MNQKHLLILKGSLSYWNRWREEHPDVRPEFQGASLIDMYLPQANLSKALLYKAYLSNVVLVYANLENANLRHAHLRAVNLRGANLSGTDFSEAMIENGDFREVKLNNANFSLADLRGADFSGVKLNSFDLHGANLTNANLSNADLSNANLKGAVFTSAILRGANLSRANLGNANLKRANLTKANLEGADLTKADLSDAELYGCNLIGVNFSSSILNYANFPKSVFESAIFRETIMGSSNLNNTKGLESCNHYGPSVIDHRTISKSGKLPINFLRGCGLSDTLIEYLPSLVGNPIQFYSCFISYSTRDRAFAERLYADLQNKGVRCWFASEDLKIGDKIRDRIDESIRVRDKLLLILSEHSIASEWVEHEVESALEEERQRGRTILFPVRIDEDVIESRKAWAALIRRTRHIGDFTYWKEHDSYHKALNRLLRDLKAEDKTTEIASGKDVSI